MSMSHRLGRMSGRDPREPHRAATPPELLFDLTFVKRYSLLVIIALGEVVLGTILTISAGVQENQWTVDAGVLAVGGTALAFGLWWVYFTVPFGTLLAVARPRPFVFGYLHYFVFGAIVAIGAGLHVAAQVLAHASELDVNAVFAVAWVAAGVLVFEGMLLAISALMMRAVDPVHLWLLAGAAAVLVVAVAAVAAGATLAWGLLIVAVSPAVLVVGYEAGGWRRTQEFVARASTAAV